MKMTYIDSNNSRILYAVEGPVIGMRVKGRRLYVRYAFTNYLPTVHFVTDFQMLSLQEPNCSGVYQVTSNPVSKFKYFLYYDYESGRWNRLAYQNFEEMRVIPLSCFPPTYFRGLTKPANKFRLSTDPNIKQLDIALDIA